MATEDKQVTIQSRFLKTCEIPLYDFKIEPFTMVIFGGAGDLAQRKIFPALYHIFLEDGFPGEFSIVGFGLPELSEADYRKFCIEAIKKFSSQNYNKKKCKEFVEKIFYLAGDLSQSSNYEKLCDKIGKLYSGSEAGSNILFYLAVQPTLLPIIVKQLNDFNLCRGTVKSKIIVEKPFGRDRESAKELNQLLLEAFDEKQIYRIDHYLGKDTVQNILFFRFGNSIFEPLWNRGYIDHIQITVAESIGIEHRGKFYEQSSIVRDIIQNHILQLLALVAMEPPVGFEADLIRDEKVKVFRTIRSMDSNYINENIICGQYGSGQIDNKKAIGYRQEQDVSSDSAIATFFAGKFYIDNWRWAGVPFYVRSGKRLKKRVSEIYVQFKQPPLRLFGRTCDVIEPNALILSIQPQEEICLRLNVKQPGVGNQPNTVYMEFNYEKSFKVKQHPPYERLLIDCIKGDLTLFARQDGVEAMWSVVDPINSHFKDNPATDFPNYSSGSWGPEQAGQLLTKDTRKWRFIDEKN